MVRGNWDLIVLVDRAASEPPVGLVPESATVADVPALHADATTQAATRATQQPKRGITPG